METHVASYDADNRRDAALVRAFQAGERDAFDVLVVRHRGRIFNLCYRMLGDFEEANDYAQETFIKVYEGLKRFRLDASFSTWLYRIAVNTCKNRLNSLAYRFRKKSVSIVETTGNNGNPKPLPLADPQPVPLEDLEARERALLIQQAIARLPADRKAVVLLRDMEGLSYEEIADVVGENLGTVKSKLSRGRQQLKEELGPMLE